MRPNGKATCSLEGRVLQLLSQLQKPFVLDTFQAIPVIFFNSGHTKMNTEGTLSSAEALPQYRRKPCEKKKAEPLQQHKRLSTQKSRFMACATTTTVQTQEGAMHMQVLSWSEEVRIRELLRIRIQTGLSQDWNYRESLWRRVPKEGDIWMCG